MYVCMYVCMAAIVKIFISVAQWQPHFTTKLFYYAIKQSPLLLFGHVNGVSECKQCYSSDEKASSYNNSMVQSKVQVQKIYPGRVIFEK